LENKVKSAVTNIERVLNSEDLSAEQKDVLIQFDRFNELESHATLHTRVSYLDMLRALGKVVKKPFEQMTKEDIQSFVNHEAKTHIDTIMKRTKEGSTND
jgi:hypothetical protein